MWIMMWMPENIIFCHISGLSKRNELTREADYRLCAVAVNRMLTCGERLDACGQSRKLARYSVAMNDALAGSPLHFRLRRPQCLTGRFLVAAGDRRLDLLDKSPHAGFARLIAFSAPLGLSVALARRSGVRHGLLSFIREEKCPPAVLTGSNGRVLPPAHRKSRNAPHRSLRRSATASFAHRVA